MFDCLKAVVDFFFFCHFESARDGSFMGGGKILTFVVQEKNNLDSGNVEFSWTVPEKQ